MKKFLTLAENLQLTAVRTGEAVSTVVQPSSSGGLRLIGVVLVIMMVILMILTVTLIMIEIRQSTLRKTIRGIARRLERMERKMDTDACGSGTRKTILQKAKSVRLSASPKISDERPETDMRNEVNKRDDLIPTYQDVSDNRTLASDTERIKKEISDPVSEAGTSSYIPESHEPVPITGLRVSVASHYIHGQVSFDEIEPADAFLLLLSDMTVSPAAKLFKVFNNPSFFTDNDFPMIYDFQDREGYLADMKHPLKCLKVSKPASVIDSQNGYILACKGIIVVEER